MKFRRSKQGKRSERTSSYKKQQAYHYSAKRSNADKLYGRSELSDEGVNTRKDNSRFGIKMLPSLAALFLLVIGILYAIRLSPSVQLETSTGEEFTADKVAIQQTASDYIKSSLLNQTKLTFNEQKLEQKLTESFPGFQSIKVKTYPFHQKASVVIEFSQPAIRLSNGTNVYIVSGDGTVLSDSSKNKPDFDTSTLPLVQDQTGITYTVGKPALTAAQADYIKEVAYQANAKNLAVETMILIPGGVELDVRYGGLPYFVKYNFFENARKSSGTFLAMKEQLDRSGSLPAEYIDVRIPERAYVK